MTGKLISSPWVMTWGGSCSTKKGWNVFTSVSNNPICPSTVEAIRDNFQLVILSANLNRTCELPCASVSSIGSHSSVSGKNSRSRGVEIGPAVPGCDTTEAIEEDSVCTSDATASTVTISETVPTFSVRLTSVMFRLFTGTRVITELRNPLAVAVTVYEPVGRFLKL